MALVYLERLPASLPGSEPSEANGEAQRSRGDDQVTSGNLLSFVVGRKEGYHSDMSWGLFVVLLSSGRDGQRFSGDVLHVMDYSRGEGEGAYGKEKKTGRHS
jgi:hypothetical protein